MTAQPKVTAQQPKATAQEAQGPAQEQPHAPPLEEVLWRAADQAPVDLEAADLAADLAQLQPQAPTEEVLWAVDLAESPEHAEAEAEAARSTQQVLLELEAAVG